jgi:hypothetical protein
LTKGGRNKPLFRVDLTNANANIGTLEKTETTKKTNMADNERPQTAKITFTKCPNPKQKCGNDTFYLLKDGKLKCTNCGWEFNRPINPPVVKAEVS